MYNPNYKSSTYNSSIYRKAIFRSSNLKKKATNAEKILYQRLEEEKIKFSFQRIFYSQANNKDTLFIVDFYIRVNKIQLVLEIDGGYHNNYYQKKYDKNREEWLRRYRSVKILRFTNEEVENKIDYVIETINNFFIEKRTMPFFSESLFRRTKIKELTIKMRLCEHDFFETQRDLSKREDIDYYTSVCSKCHVIVRTENINKKIKNLGIFKKKDLPKIDNYSFLAVMANGNRFPDKVVKIKNSYTSKYLNCMVGWTKNYLYLMIINLLCIYLK